MLTAVTVAIFFLAAWQLNPLALKLAPLALAILFFYSYTKRFTNWSHLFLGFALGISPAAAWIAVTGGLDLRMLILCAAVRCGSGDLTCSTRARILSTTSAPGSSPCPRNSGSPTLC